MLWPTIFLTSALTSPSDMFRNSDVSSRERLTSLSRRPVVAQITRYEGRVRASYICIGKSVLYIL
ncbi:hypothetical protein EON63_17310 [archaeon]|nr:MAG: hypothetical protein EON63_17310 [archaeon]